MKLRSITLITVCTLFLLTLVVALGTVSFVPRVFASSTGDCTSEFPPPNCTYASTSAAPGTVTCGTDPTVTLSFIAGKNSPKVSGSGNIVGTGVTLAFSFVGGSINSHGFNLKGELSTFSVCGTATTGGSTGEATLSGDCGTGVTINYQDSLGDQATFTGTVNCHETGP